MEINSLHIVGKLIKKQNIVNTENLLVFHFHYIFYFHFLQTIFNKLSSKSVMTINVKF